MSVLISFGQDHAHVVNGKTFDKDCLARVRNRGEAFKIFGPKWSMEYPDTQEDINSLLPHFPRGIINVNSNTRANHTFTESDDY